MFLHLLAFVKWIIMNQRLSDLSLNIFVLWFNTNVKSLTETVTYFSATINEHDTFFCCTQPTSKRPFALLASSNHLRNKTIVFGAQYFKQSKIASAERPLLLRLLSHTCIVCHNFMTCVTCCVHCNKVSAQNRACGEPRDCTTDTVLDQFQWQLKVSLSLFLLLSALGVIVCVGGWLVYLVHCSGVAWLASYTLSSMCSCHNGWSMGRSGLGFYCLCYFIVKISSEQQGSLSILLYCTVVEHAIKTIVWTRNAPCCVGRILTHRNTDSEIMNVHADALYYIIVLQPVPHAHNMVPGWKWVPFEWDHVFGGFQVVALLISLKSLQFNKWLFYWKYLPTTEFSSLFTLYVCMTDDQMDIFSKAASSTFE